MVGNPETIGAAAVIAGDKRKFCKALQDYDPATIPNAELERQATCSSGHPLKDRVVNWGREMYNQYAKKIIFCGGCNKCRKALKTGDHVLRCSKCDYDLCDSCGALLKGEEVGAGHVRL